MTSNLRNMRFYFCFPNCDAVSHKLSWTHYRKLIRIENPNARIWYQKEAIEQHWSARALERQVNKLLKERSCRGYRRAILEPYAAAPSWHSYPNTR
ncbi:DUF1016 N-terminal domain-containing protein [Methylobacter sp. BBA5.1]|uniref:DUF1016 N-terminal domain-containing protein n=1 Tax=Methylobacter sp. BBA5.1 TaxID=1495064 RepID=UPI0021019B1C|nr:DUF1016 N-terminal domain-containing protein [Methylobacter sp. BBA5.1]